MVQTNTSAKTKKTAQATKAPKAQASRPRPAIPRLTVGVKRFPRKDESQIKRAQLELLKQQPAIHERDEHRCVFCGFKSKTLNQIHHLDDDHFNNNASNLVTICKLCHPYHHLGQAPDKLAKQVIGEVLRAPATGASLEDGKIEGSNVAAILIRAPISAADMNHLLRAIAIGLADPSEEKVAKQILELLSHKSLIEQTVKSFMPNTSEGVKALLTRDVANGLLALTNDEYKAREKAVGDLRLIYSPILLKKWGQEIRADSGGFSNPGEWEKQIEKQLICIGLLTEPSEQNEDTVGAEALPSGQAAEVPTKSGAARASTSKIEVEEVDPDEEQDDDAY